MFLSLLKLIRFQNLLLVIACQFLIKYALFESFGIAVTLGAFDFFLLCLATVCIAAAGNIINDLYDVETDRLNKPHRQVIPSRISEKFGYNLYLILTVTGVGIGFYLSNLIGRPGFSAIFIIISALLYLYATYLKQVILVGNIIISLLVAMVIIIVGLYDLLPAITPQNQNTQAVIFSILLDYATFAFMINLLREMVKDQEDVTGDYNTGRNSLPIAVGRSRANKIIFALGLIPLATIIWYMYEYLFTNTYAVIYVLILIVGPLLIFEVNLLNAKKKIHYARLSLLLKIVMALGLLSLGLYPFII
ncbi:prenyltransferase [Antarcticibacterium flavum]|uniref:Prenyltransferase n=1 Tax=Antarcticibacterium flavum TaxID=2058175 RepID=A0A5B7WYH8_9FLAO|nr:MULTISPECIES: geranylgeranylglycerol-phosphate geranylgeranyltransferase [Antarcticibacterium]MCM4159016.1 prenyltransferase [Antarcticibacterium sp. W02-3]QCY68264.1 prenyltransferase [Antarcticibacterium flavum]